MNKINSLKIRDFKDEFRLICTDVWADALDAWFEATGQMCIRWIDIPKEWKYKAGLCPLNEDSYFNEMFENCSDEEITAIAHFIYRYCRILKHFGKSY
jgi:hypothetical protein